MEVCRETYILTILSLFNTIYNTYRKPLPVGPIFPQIILYNDDEIISKVTGGLWKWFESEPGGINAGSGMT